MRTRLAVLALIASFLTAVMSPAPAWAGCCDLSGVNAGGRGCADWDSALCTSVAGAGKFSANAECTSNQCVSTGDSIDVGITTASRVFLDEPVAFNLSLINRESSPVTIGQVLLNVVGPDPDTCTLPISVPVNATVPQGGRINQQLYLGGLPSGTRTGKHTITSRALSGEETVGSGWTRINVSQTPGLIDAQGNLKLLSTDQPASQADSDPRVDLVSFHASVNLSTDLFYARFGLAGGPVPEVIPSDLKSFSAGVVVLGGGCVYAKRSGVRAVFRANEVGSCVGVPGCPIVGEVFLCNGTTLVRDDTVSVGFTTFGNVLELFASLPPGIPIVGQQGFPVTFGLVGNQVVYNPGSTFTFTSGTD